MNEIKFAQRMYQLPPYLFGTINKMRMEKRLKGDDVIDLGMGNPVDPTPEVIVEKLREVTHDPKSHRYPIASGLKNLKREIAKTYEKDYQVKLDSESEVICTIGSKEGISHLCLAIIGPGDTVLVPAPAFPIHIYAVTIAGGNVIRIPLGTDFSSNEDVFLKKIADMCESLYPRPKVLILNFPHNPTAALAGRDFFKEIVIIAKKYNLIVVNDFAYSKITFDGYTAPSFMEIPGAVDVGVEFGSFSKSYNMAGWRLGYCVGNKKLIEGLAKIKGYYDYGVFSPIQIAGIVALRDCDDDILKQAAIYQQRRDVLCTGLEKMGWSVEKPKAGMFAWVKIPEKYNQSGKDLPDSMDFSIKMMEKANVAMSPGIGFGEEGEGWLRLALVENEHRIRQALKQMRRALPD
ncbi:Aminotransferase family protein, class I and II [Desulfonema limicola]|uniref:Aminotransferase n=1 Tax=Desulfonema limicola TaxID=45656 RepID=A0A975GI08_9BACT|nr:aminotransferase class I/II-fold pyridoxal phosphate-dependent enzyme [Desulfonema limicola]QTA82110.1 Aminotransferase family protein, class I and II [Desulfonema limicola]